MSSIDTRHKTWRPIVACGLAIALGACGGSDSDFSAAAARVGADEVLSIDIVGDDFSYSGMTESVVAGTRLNLRNASDEELHELVAIRLPDDEERSVGELLALPPAELGEIGPPAAVILAPPSETGFAVVGTGTLDEPGRYLIFCAIPIGADPGQYLEAAATSDGPPDVPGGAPHFTEGMAGEIIVTDR